MKHDFMHEPNMALYRSFTETWNSGNICHADTDMQVLHCVYIGS